MLDFDALFSPFFHSLGAPERRGQRQSRVENVPEIHDAELSRQPSLRTRPILVHTIEMQPRDGHGGSVFNILSQAVLTGVRVRQQDKGGAAWVLILLMTTNEQQCKGEEQDFSPEFVMRDEHGIQAPRVFKRSRGSLRGDLMDIHATPTIGLGIIKPKLLVDVPPAARVSSFRYMTAKCGTNVAPRPPTLSSNDNTELKQSKQPVAECQDNGRFE
ncbi:unnamed protein product [Clonostachys chloroleuca]|uniref:Uncharacterized protein n=1 Tax=Clonostachys chloroleuca TaxID=1926264 RepID=A0AA35LVF6_9HYPO|nr:unnamed protein product [Clonostachys chloroleuca]